MATTLRSKKPKRAFRPKIAVALLPDANADRITRVSEMAGLVAWAILDQYGEKVQDDRPKLRTRHAKRLRVLVWAHLADKAQPPLPKRDIRSQIKMFGGLARLVDGPSFKQLLANVREQDADLRYTLAIVTCLIRAQIAPPENMRITLGDARRFVEKSPPAQAPAYGDSKIQQIWYHYRFASPYIFAVYSVAGFDRSVLTSKQQFISWLESLIDDPTRVDALLSSAACAERAIASSLKVSRKDFRHIADQGHALTPLTENDWTSLRQIKREKDEPIA